MVVLEKITAPASRSRAAGGASWAAGKSFALAEPSGTGTPLCQRAVEAFAAARAPSGSKAYSALMCGSKTSTCASTSSSTSEGENCRARYPEIRSTAERSWNEVMDSSDATLCMGACRKPGFDDACEHAGANGQNFVIKHVARVVHGHRAVMADPEIGAGNGLQHVGEILAAHFGLGRGEDLCRIDDGARDFLDHPRLLLLVDQDAEGFANVGVDLDSEG